MMTKINQPKQRTLYPLSVGIGYPTLMMADHIQQEYTAVTDQREPQGSRRHGTRVAQAERNLKTEKR